MPPALVRQNACHFYWNDGPPRSNTWVWENVPPLKLHEIVCNLGIEVSFRHMCDKLLEYAEYSRYCDQWSLALY